MKPPKIPLRVGDFVQLFHSAHRRGYVKYLRTGVDNDPIAAVKFSLNMPPEEYYTWGLILLKRQVPTSLEFII